MSTAPAHSGKESLKSVVAEYLLRFPEERAALRQLLEQLEAADAEPGNLLDRQNMAGHCTSSVLVLNQAMSRALLIHHKTYDIWIPAGGHHEKDCATLHESAWREVAEETGLRDLQVIPGLGMHLLDIDTHAIPARPSKGELSHWHHDFMFLGVAGHDFTPIAQETEVHAAAWRRLVDLEHDQVARNRRIFAKVIAALKLSAAAANAPELPEVLPVADVGRFVIDFARRHGVHATRTKLDEFAEAVSRLSGDEIRLDQVGQTLVALRERGLVTGAQMNRLMFNHLRERKGRPGH